MQNIESVAKTIIDSSSILKKLETMEKKEFYSGRRYDNTRKGNTFSFSKTCIDELHILKKQMSFNTSYIVEASIFLLSELFKQDAKKAIEFVRIIYEKRNNI